MAAELDLSHDAFVARHGRGHRSRQRTTRRGGGGGGGDYGGDGNCNCLWGRGGFRRLLAGRKAARFSRRAAGAACEARPKQCRSYPWWPRLLASPEEWHKEEAKCEGILPPPDEAVVADATAAVGSRKECDGGGGGGGGGGGDGGSGVGSGSSGVFGSGSSSGSVGEESEEDFVFGTRQRCRAARARCRWITSRRKLRRGERG